MASPYPEPTSLKILKGNPGKRPLPVDEPMPPRPARVPPPPDGLSGRAREKWRDIAGKLHRLGLLTGVDVDALALYCQSWARMTEAEDEIALSGLVTLGSTGKSYVVSPHVLIAQAEAGKCFAFLTAFGMTPSSRAKVRAAPESGPKSKFLGLIKGQNGQKEQEKQRATG